MPSIKQSSKINNTIWQNFAKSGRTDRNAVCKMCNLVVVMAVKIKMDFFKNSFSALLKRLNICKYSGVFERVVYSDILRFESSHRLF